MKFNEFASLYCAFASGVCFLGVIVSVVEQSAVKATINTVLFFINLFLAYVNMKGE